MSGNTFGTLFTVTTFGESHGKALGCIIDGCPPGLPLSEEQIQPFLDKRRPGQTPYTSSRREADVVEVLSGVFQGLTTGTPIALMIRNQDAQSKDYDALEHQFRPGHADFTYQHKYGIRDHRGGGRASARETVARVAAGAVARLYLLSKGIDIQGHLAQMGPLVLKYEDKAAIDQNPFFCPNQQQVPELEAYIDDLRQQGDSVGALITVKATGVPIGLGDPVFDKLDANLAYAMMSINAVKAVSMGDGFSVVTQLGSEHRDVLTKEGFITNHAGGVLGGISNGQTIITHLALKPTSSIAKPIKTLTTAGEETELRVQGRHDPCVGIRAVPIAEAMMALVLMDHYLRHQAII